jgi:hypothetical protein
VSSICRPRIDDNALPGRTAVVVERERRQWPGAAAELREALGRSSDEATDDEDVALELDDITDGLSSTEPDVVPTAAFLAGRCEPVDGLADAVASTVARYDPAQLRASAWDFVESCFAWALLGAADEAAERLRLLVGPEAVRSTEAHRAAAYLAQIGDPSGWPTFVHALEQGNDHVKLMAARLACYFEAFTGTEVDGLVVDPVAALRRLAADAGPWVAPEIPSLLEELGAD